ncbi:unnamed protein product [Chondrus crispus]|uniref:Uncharacterized protein n=1 Tax=Chondrus crispus TaxID=2769 RepID=R7QFR5_CHOCR|nr:unnamed protein product [Chondrus crispus]CDF36265.1 unnamed protein product [Chondrus crispus]|eukprot:XP_005716084.1 unnamed protein product [Chondrus crispus]
MDASVPVWIERGLITVAFVTSALLAVTTAMKKWLRHHACLEMFLVVVSASLCFLTGLTGLLLFLFGKLSLDAFGVVLVGLIPGIEASSRLRMSVLRPHACMRKRPALHRRPADFCYLRHGPAPPADVQQSLELDTKCDIRTYIRCPYSSKKKSLEKPIGESRKEMVSMWHANVLQVEKNVVNLQDLDDSGDSIAWWYAANDALHLVRNPSKARFTKSVQVTRALELVAELAMIGDAIFEYHGQSLRNYANGAEELTDALYRTPASVYTEFLGAVGILNAWGRVDMTLRNSFVNRFHFLRRGEKYGMLFFILLTKSSLFNFDSGITASKDGEHTSAIQIIEIFRKTCSRKERTEVTGRWLAGYGLLPTCLSRYKKDDAEPANGIDAMGRTTSYTLTPFPIDTTVDNVRLDMDTLWPDVQGTYGNNLATQRSTGRREQALVQVRDHSNDGFHRGRTREIRLILPMTMDDLDGSAK